MRKLLNILILLIATVAMGQTKKLQLESSNLRWEAKKVIAGGHKGTLTFKSGELIYKNNELVGGSLIVDMNSLAITDEGMDTKGKANLVKHLKSDDFFSVKKYATASLMIKEVTKIQNGYKAQGELTIKGITKPLDFELFRTATEGLSSTVDIDRTQFGIKYGSGSFFSNLGDKAIEDKFTIYVYLSVN